jgi:hypothetical protein
MTEVGFSAKETFIARSSLVEVIKGIAKVVHGITPVTNWSVIACHDGTDTVHNATDMALSEVLLMFIRHTSAQMNAFSQMLAGMMAINQSDETKAFVRWCGRVFLQSD